MTALSCIGSWAGCTEDPETGAQPVACERLADLTFSGVEDFKVQIESSVAQPAAEELPAFCRVVGVVAPQVRFELRLPPKPTWNTKFYMAGCGGLCGSIDPDLPHLQGFSNSCNFGLRKNYAVAVTDTGHAGKSAYEASYDGTWAAGRPDLERDFADRGVHAVAVVAKAILAAHYGQPARRAYFGGCSNGGRQALIAAQRYPLDFDGVVAGAPALELSRNMLAFAWAARANLTADGGRILTAEKLAPLHDAVLAACDGGDGLRDGLIDDPRACAFSPASMLCAEGDGPTCLTRAQVEAVEKLYAGPTDSRGRSLFAGLPKGSEPDWAYGVTGTESFPVPLSQLLSDAYLRYLAFEPDPGASYDPRSFDFDSALAALAPRGALYDATATDLRAFRDRGGKLILYHGWADGMIPPSRTVEYYEALTRDLGGSANTAPFARLFMIPGLQHCDDGPLGAPIDFLTLLDDWSERGRAPDRVLASRPPELELELGPRVRPVFPHPTVARYVGAGSVDEAANFAPVAP